MGGEETGERGERGGSEVVEELISVGVWTAPLLDWAPIPPPQTSTNKNAELQGHRRATAEPSRRPPICRFVQLGWLGDGWDFKGWLVWPMASVFVYCVLHVA